MKGIILAGGSGTRLHPITKGISKQLMPIYDKPMIYYPIQTLVSAGVEDILVVTGGNNAGDFLRLLGNGAEFGLKRLQYAYQEKEGGIAQALSLAEHFAEGEKLVVMLGDNIIEGNIVETVEEFSRQEKGAKILLKEVDSPQEYGVAEIRDGKIVAIVEKPAKPVSNYAVIGIYLYDAAVFDIVRTLEPSGRGELEITDVNNAYIAAGTMTYGILDGWWADAGASIDRLLKVNALVYESGANKMAL